MRNLKILFGIFALSIFAIIITGIVLSYLGIEHGSLLIKIGSIFVAVNIILYLLFLIFSVIRNFINLYIEKKHKIIGSKFRTKLVFAFVGLTLIPSILLFILSNQLINNSIDKWFSLEVQRPIDDSMNIAKTFYSEKIKNIKEYADFLASNAGIIDINKTIKNKEGDFKIHFSKNPEESEFIRNVFSGTADTEIVSTKEGDKTLKTLSF